MNTQKFFFQLIKKSKKKFNGNKFFLHEPYITNSDKKSLKKSLDTNEVSTYGKYTNIFENKLKKYLKSKNLICLINGTSALHLSLKVFNINKNHEVFVSAMTYISTVNAIRYCDAKPHFFDIDVNTLSIDLKKFEKYLKNSTILKNNRCINIKTGKQIKALIVTHVNGLTCKIDILRKILKKNNILLIEDAAEALGCFYKGKALGTFGDAGILSFNGNKIITTGGGGAIILNSKKMLKYAYHLSNNAKIKKKNDIIHDMVGFNYRMPSINASLGISQLQKINKYLKLKKKLHLFYKNLFDNSDFKLLKPIKECKSNYWLNTIVINNNIKIKDNLINLSLKNKFYVRPLWKPINELEPFKKFPKMNLDNTIDAYNRIISLPSSVFLMK